MHMTMEALVTLVYLLFTICVIYPPTEFVSAGFTIAQLFDSFLGSENINFMRYHMKRVSLTLMIHCMLPLGYIFSLWCAGYWASWVVPVTIGSSVVPGLMLFRIICWWEDPTKNPAVWALLKYVTEGSDWRVVAADINTEFRSVDKVSVPLMGPNKFVATQTWLIKVNQYNLDVIKQEDCTLVATSTDSYSLSTSGNEDVQYVNIDVIPTIEGNKFSLRISTTALWDLQPRLLNPVRVPDHISLMPTLVDRFVIVFKQHIDQNPVEYVEQEPEQCIGCMQAQADVRLSRHCMPPPAHLVGGPPQCQQCNCRVLWCAGCMGRWWAARAAGAPSTWLSGRCTCPVCRAVFCMLDVCPVRVRAP